MISKYAKLLPPLLFFLFICIVIGLADTKGTQFVLGIVPKIRYGDKIGHFFLFGILGLLLNQSLNFKTIRISKVFIYLGSLIVLIFAVAEEFSQLALANRTFDWMDMLCDFLGVWLLSHKMIQNYYKKWVGIALHRKENSR